MEEQYNKYEILAIHLDPRFGNIYEYNMDGGDVEFDVQEWTDELRVAVRDYLHRELPADVSDRLLISDGGPVDGTNKAALVDEVLESQPWEVAIAVRNAAVAAVPTLRQLIGDFDEWPSEDERLDADNWLDSHMENISWSEIVRSSRRFDLLPVQVTSWNNRHLGPADLVHALTPGELLHVWEDVVGAESDLTDEEWRLMVPHFGLSRNRYGSFPRSNRELEAKRRMLNGIRFKLSHDVRWTEVPARYGRPSSAYQGYRGYQSSGLFARLHQALRGNNEARRIVAWLEQIANADRAKSATPTEAAA
ncbi:transposase [Nocardia vinacea]|uniref:transposase n=1 Tax=Nocardia vinacea TaxID=96468 RepID=UPI0005928333|nr:transposase [Nocardia vinacea]